MQKRAGKHVLPYQDIGNGYAVLNTEWCNAFARGSYGELYICHKILQDGQLSPEEYIAKKVLMLDQANTETRMKNEVEISDEMCKKTEHIVKVYSHFRDKRDGSLYIIMEYCKGGNLDTYLDNQVLLSEDIAIKILMQIVNVFVILHKNKIVHRDLKPANIVIDKPIKEGEIPYVKVTDFGISTEALKSMYSEIGTQRYMAPEITKEGHYFYYVDIWSFGIMLYKMIYGIFPVDIGSEAQIFQEGIIKFPRIRVITIECLDLILKCLRLAPEKRISFEEMVQHPFFNRDESNINYCDWLFDGCLGYREFSIKEDVDYLKNPEKLPHFQILHDEFLESHNEKVLMK